MGSQKTTMFQETLKFRSQRALYPTRKDHGIRRTAANPAGFREPLGDGCLLYHSKQSKLCPHHQGLGMIWRSSGNTIHITKYVLTISHQQKSCKLSDGQLAMLPTCLGIQQAVINWYTGIAVRTIENFRDCFVFPFTSPECKNYSTLYLRGQCTFFLLLANAMACNPNIIPTCGHIKHHPASSTRPRKRLLQQELHIASPAATHNLRKQHLLFVSYTVYERTCRHSSFLLDRVSPTGCADAA